MTTVAEAIVKVARNMSLVEGTNMSPYSDDQISQYLSDANDMLMMKFDWPELTRTVTKTLDGTTGKITVGFTASDKLMDYKYIKRVYSSALGMEAPKITQYGNPLFENPLIGYEFLNIVDDPNKQYFFRFLPVTLAGTVAVVYSIKLDFSDPDTVIPIDDLLHIWIATWMWAEDDGTNPGQAEKFKLLWEDRITDLRSNVNQGPISLTPYNGQLNEWREY